MRTSTDVSTSAADAAERRGRSGSSDRPWLTILLFWMAVTTLLVGFTVAMAKGVPYFGDDAMRMVTIVELLEGQHWQDLSLDRDNTPYGTTMHWSRLIDLPIAGLVLLARPFVGHPLSLDVAASIWSSLLLLGLLLLSVRFVRATVPDADTMTGLALPVVSIVILIEFLPGRVDHHNVQILLGLCAAIALTGMRRRIAGGVIAGLAVATSLAIGMESIPIVVATIAIFALLWLADPSAYRGPLAAFGVVLATATTAHFLFATAPADYAMAVCDMLSITYVVPAIVGGGALALIAWSGTGRGNVYVRGALLAAGGGVTLAVVALFFPQCLAGPYASAEALISFPGYMDTLSETRSLGTYASDDPATGAVFAAAVLIALPITVWAAVASRGEQRVTWLIVLGFLALSALVMVVQIRGARLATPFALPAGAWLVTLARQRYLNNPTVWRSGLLAASWLLFSGASYYALAIGYYMALAPTRAAAAAFDTTAHMSRQCVNKESFAALATLPPGRVIAPFRIGPHILLHTPHSTVSAGFHRNIDGTRDAIRFFLDGEAKARELVAERGIDYVVVCGSADDFLGGIGPTPDTHWTWLEPLTPLDAEVVVYGVRP